MTSQGSARGRFGRALATGNATIVLAAAAELGQLTLADALAVPLLLLPAAPPRPPPRGPTPLRPRRRALARALVPRDAAGGRRVAARAGGVARARWAGATGGGRCTRRTAREPRPGGGGTRDGRLDRATAVAHVALAPGRVTRA